ncbi:MOSC domain-containing protein [Yoonia sp. 208BN28-4]|uniref:MOSC domain-containing protein n=1 Tax=Yoonia sp. 208BN28-4 TaxID=3126505 RepID=UPI00309E23FB
MGTVAEIWRHPIKSHGREKIESVDLTAGMTMPWDRKYAVTHAQTKFSAASPDWVSCRNFMIGTMTPALAGIWSQVDEAANTITLRHADAPEFTFDPDAPTDVARFLSWVSDIIPADRQTPTALVSAPDRGMTDTPEPTMSIANLASHATVEGHLGHPLERERWRANIWLDGLDAWAEDDWIGKTIRIGSATFAVIDMAERCKHTTANPVTGARDVDTLAALRNGWGHQNFSAYATVLTDGRITVGDTCEVL